MSTNFCRHIRANGTRCNSPALHREPLCYFHDRERRRYPNRRQSPLAGEPLADFDVETIIHPLNPDLGGLQRNPLVQEYFGNVQGPVTLDFPPLEDRESIQIAVSMVTSALGQGLIDIKRAGMMLYALQVASANAKTLVRDPHTVTHTVPAADGHDLAPDEDPVPEPQPLGSAARMLLELQSLSGSQTPSHQDFPPTPGEGAPPRTSPQPLRSST